MIEYNITVRFSRCGEFEDSSDYTVEIPDNITEDDDEFMDALLDAIRPDIEDMYEVDEDEEEDEDWVNGDISWEIFSWEKV